MSNRVPSQPPVQNFRFECLAQEYDMWRDTSNCRQLSSTSAFDWVLHSKKRPLGATLNSKFAFLHIKSHRVAPKRNECRVCNSTFASHAWIQENSLPFTYKILLKSLNKPYMLKARCRKENTGSGALRASGVETAGGKSLEPKAIAIFAQICMSIGADATVLRCSM